MPIASEIKNALGSSSMIRKMFEEGIQLKKQYGDDKVFDFSLGNPDLEPPPAFHRVFLKLAKEDKKGSHGYMPNAGYPEVRQALAEKISGEHKVKIDFSHVIMSAGASGALNTVLKTICSAGDEVIITRPYFMEYRSYTGNFGAKLVEVDSKENFDLNLELVEKDLSEKTQAVLINSPNNPTGRVYSASIINGLGELLRAHGKKTGRLPYLIADEPYREIVFDGIEVPSVLGTYSEAIVVNSYSKSLSLPGERIGYIAVGPDINDKNDVINGMIHSARVLGYVNAPALMQRIVAELTFARVNVDVYARRKNAFKEILDAAGIKYAEPQGAFYLFCKVPQRDDDPAFVDHLKKHLILGVPGSSFGKPGWIRLAYCVDEKIIRNSADAFVKAMGSW